MYKLTPDEMTGKPFTLCLRRLKQNTPKAVPIKNHFYRTKDKKNLQSFNFSNNHGPMVNRLCYNEVLPWKP